MDNTRNKVISQQAFNARALPINQIVLAQQCVLFPLYFFIPLWIVFLNVTVALMVAWRSQQHKLAINKWIKLLITVVAIAGVLTTFQKISGREAGVALISVMYGLKILETKKTRDANILLILGFFILVAGFLFSQKPWIAFYQVIPIFAILNALVAMQSLETDKSIVPISKSVIKKLTKYLLLALPIMVVLFIFFPRLSGPIWRMPGSSTGTTGISDSMTPGDISRLNQDDEIAFRVKFEGAEPDPSQLYWRVLVLDQYDGVSWTRENARPIYDPQDPFSKTDNTLQKFVYSITLEPTKQNFLVTLDRPVKTPLMGQLLQDYVAYSRYRILDRMRYEVISAPEYKIGLDLLPEKRKEFTALTHSGNSKSKSWAVKQRQIYTNDWEYIYAILGKINQQEYFYTLNPPIMDEDMVDSFWFDHQRGFCEHYAGALVFLARAANIPARVVIGYQGGEKNPLSNYWIVRNSNAHAWTEIWIENKGWVRVDPTSAIAQHRVEQGLVSDYRSRDSLFDEFDFVELDDIGLFKQFEYWTDQFNNRWNDWILDYDDQSQRDLFKNLGWSGFSKQQMIIIMIVVVALFVLLTSIKWFHQKNRKQPLTMAYNTFLKKLERKNIAPVNSSMGPNDLKKHLSQLGVIRFQHLILLLDEYIQLRYREEAPNDSKLKSLVRRFKSVSIKKL
jgi:transglutaminase-like putative cysteine protease